MNDHTDVKTPDLPRNRCTREPKCANANHMLGAAELSAYLASILESSDDAIVGTSLDGTIFSWNAGAERLYGYRHEEMVGRSIAVLVPPQRWEELARIQALLREGQRVVHMPTLRRRKDGRQMFVSLTVSPIVRDDSEIIGTSSIARNVSDQKRARGTVLEALGRLRAVVNTAVDGIITIDERGIIETVNPSALQTFGYAEAELIGRNVQVLMPEPYRSEHDGYLSDYLTTGERKIIGIGREVRGRRKDGSEFPMDLAVSETRLGGRRVFTGIIRNITQRIEAERSLRESETRFRLMANSAPTLIWMSDVEKACTWFNKRWLEFTGRTMEDELGDGWAEGVHPDDLALCTRTYHTAFDAREPFEMEYRLRRFDGEYRWVRDSGVPNRLEDGKFVGYIGSCIDITENRLGERVLRDRVAQRTRELTAANEQLQHQIEERRRVEAHLATENKILELIATGALQESLLDAICRAIESLIPDARCAIRLVRGQGNGRAPSAVDQDQPVRMGLEVFGSMSEQGIYPPLVQERTIVSHVPPSRKAAFGAQDVRSYWYEPIVAPGGAVVGTLGVYSLEAPRTDEDALSVGAMATRLAGIVVERARAEVRAREQLAQLAHVARLATMGEMASGLAHELNQPLCAIVNFTEACAELVRHDGHHREPLRETLGEVAKQAERAGQVIRRLRDFVRRREPERQPVDINGIVQEVIAFTKVEARHSEARVRTKLAKRLPKVFADSIQVEQVLVNLVRNACDAMRDAGRNVKVLTIETARRKGAIEVTVHDTGPGIPEDLKSRLFEPFFTTKEKGMGMGLSITRSILEVHDGDLWVTANREGGSTFHFTLPTAWRVLRGRRHRIRSR